jgi:hypothetical protein
VPEQCLHARLRHGVRRQRAIERGLRGVLGDPDRARLDRVPARAQHAGHVGVVHVQQRVADVEDHGSLPATDGHGRPA